MKRRRTRSRSRTPERYNPSRYHRSRSRSPPPRFSDFNSRRRGENRSPADRNRGKEHWLPVSPCLLQHDVTVEKSSTMMVTVAQRAQFSFRENKGCMVRITKWTGRDFIGCIHIKPQIVNLDENIELQIEVENPYPEKNIYLKKHDNIACLSILTSPIPSHVFSSVHSSYPEDYEHDKKRWFKVTSVVLHKKGMQLFHLGYLGC